MNRKKQQKTKKQKNLDKKASLKDAINKIVDVVKKPFSKKNGKDQRKNRSQKEKILISQKDEIQNQDSIDSISYENEQQQIQQDIPFAENSTITQLSKFFYSNDKFIETFDDEQLYDAITKHYPGLLANESNEQTKRKTVIDLLNNNEFMSNILENYNMTILDFFKFLFRLCPSIFKGFFVKKVQKTLKTKKYAKSVKFSQYNFSRRRKKKAARKY